MTWSTDLAQSYLFYRHKRRVSFKLQLTHPFVSTLCSTPNLALACWRPQSPFSCSRLFTKYLIYLPLLNNLLSAAVHRPERKGSEESRLGGTSLGGARAPPRSGEPLTVSSVLQNRHLRPPRGHSSNQRSLESRGGLARAERSLQT